MESPMAYYKRSAVGNRIGQWRPVDSPYRQWIHNYFRQPVRDHPVIVVTQEDGNDIAFECMAETNDKISGVTTGGQRMEIVWCREDRADETLARYR